MWPVRFLKFYICTQYYFALGPINIVNKQCGKIYLYCFNILLCLNIIELISVIITFVIISKVD